MHPYVVLRASSNFTQVHSDIFTDSRTKYQVHTWPGSRIFSRHISPEGKDPGVSPQSLFPLETDLRSLRLQRMFPKGTDLRSLRLQSFSREVLCPGAYSFRICTGVLDLWIQSPQSECPITRGIVSHNSGRAVNPAPKMSQMRVCAIN